jgi:hypothetical protein
MEAQQSTEHILLCRVLGKPLLAAPIMPLVTVAPVATDG